MCWWGWADLGKNYMVYLFLHAKSYFYYMCLHWFYSQVCLIPRVVVVFSLLVVCLDVIVSWVSFCFFLLLLATEFWFPGMCTLLDSNSCVYKQSTSATYCCILISSAATSPRYYYQSLLVEISYPIHISPACSEQTPHHCTQFLFHPGIGHLYLAKFTWIETNDPFYYTIFIFLN